MAHPEIARRADMKLIFYKTVQGSDGRPVARRVMTVEAAAARRLMTAPAAGLPTRRPRLDHWRRFADFFEIV
jgi:hypothetical protein